VAAPIIELDDVRLTLESRAGPVDILRGVDLRISRGQSVAVVGPSGSGKTSLLMVLAGLERVTSGHVTVAGQDLGRLGEDDLARVRGQNIGIVFQSFHLVPTMTALENVALPLQFSGKSDAFETARAQDDLRNSVYGNSKKPAPEKPKTTKKKKVSVANNNGTTPRAIVGFYGEADGTLLFALTELHPNDGRQTNPATNSNRTNFNENGNVADYSFTTPAGWSRTDSAGKIVLSRGAEHKIEFLPLTNSSGNLERDAERIIWQVFKGCDAWYSNGFEADWGTFEKGRTAQGLEYYRVYRYAKKASEENNGFARSRFDAILLLVKLGGKVAVVAGSQPFQTDFSRDSTLSAVDLILYDLKFKSVTDAYDPKNDLLGSWSGAGGSVALAYTFNADGTFHKGAATEFRTPYDPERDKVRRTSYGMTQSYSLTGNVLTQNYKQTGEVVRYKIRIYHTRYDKDAWQHKLGFLPLENQDGGTIVLQRGN